MAATQTVLILGSTGEVGSKLLLAALASPSISKVHTVGRTSPSLPSTTPGFAKLQSSLVDFEKLAEGSAEEVAKLKNSEVDTVLISLGTTLKNAGSMEKFVRIDKEYVLHAARAARIEGKEQKLVYCSSGGASSSSPFPYLKSKGLTEEGLASIGYSSTLIFRPGYLVVPGGRKEHRLIESVMGFFMNVAATFSNAVQVDTPAVGNAMINAITRSQKFGKIETLAGHSVWSISNAGIMKLEVGEE